MSSMGGTLGMYVEGAKRGESSFAVFTCTRGLDCVEGHRWPRVVWQARSALGCMHHAWKVPFNEAPMAVESILFGPPRRTYPTRRTCRGPYEIKEMKEMKEMKQATRT